MDRQRTGTILDSIAKIIRIITVPPVLVTALLLLVWGNEPEIFAVPYSLPVAVITLGIFPVLSYVFWALIPSFRRKGRDAQRKIAFVFTFIGYLAGMLYGWISHVPARLQLIFNSYFLTVAVLFVINFLFKIKASGHSASVTGPLLFCVVYIGWIALAPCLLIEAASFWASLRTKRHTMTQLLIGALIPAAAFLASWLISLTGRGV